MLQKTLLTALILLFCSFSAFGQPLMEDKEEQKTLTLWQFWPESWMQPELDAFEKETGYKVKIERLTWSDGLNKIITSLAANQAPDVIEIGSTWVAGFSRDGGLQELHPKELKAQLNLWEPATYQGKVYAIPWTLSTAQLFYNKKLLQEAGLTVPKTWAELLYASEKIKSLSPKINGYGLKTGSYTTWQKFLPFAWSNEARLLDGELPRVTDPNFIAAIGYYQELKKHSLFDDNLVVRKAFQEGRVGFMIEEPGQIIKFKKETPDLEFGVVTLPKSPKGKSIVFAGGQMLAITKNSKNPVAAWALIQHLSKPKAVKAITSKITTLFPAQKNAAQDPFYQKEHPELLVFLESLSTATSPMAHPKWVEIQEVFSEHLERIMYGLSDKNVAMEAAEKEIIAIIQKKGNTTGKPIQFEAGWVYFPLLALMVFGAGLWGYKYKGLDTVGKVKAMRGLRYQRNTLLFLAPWVLVFLVFSLYPIAHSLFLSFTEFRATSETGPIFIGMENYQNLIQDTRFLDSIWNSFLFVFGTVPVILIMAVLFAVVLNQKLKFRSFYRTSYFMPVVTSVMVIATLFIELYAPQGIINDFLALFGIPAIHWLKDPNWALPSIMIMNIWASFGFYTLMLLAGLQNIPEEYYEASALEGAGKIRQFFTITLPLLKPTLLVAALMDVILAFQVFGEILVMTKGGPLRSTETSVYYLYDIAFHKQQLGYSSAAAYIIFVILMVFSLTQFVAFRSKD